MKKFILILSISLLCIIIYNSYIYVNNSYSNFIRQPADQIVNSSPSPTPYSSPTVSWNGIIYAYEYFEVTDITKLFLIANFAQKRSSELIMRENKCQYAINGGYYDTNNKPLGLFKNDELHTSAILSALINGYLSITSKPVISFELQQDPIIALQTGPMLIVDGNKLKLKISNDEFARRMVAGINSKGTLVFITIFVPGTMVQGPKLTDLPDILTLIPLHLTSAINLDGGNASIFKNTNIYIPEVSSVGSLFCLR